MPAHSSAELTTYLNEVGRFPVLTKETQLLHCRRIHAWVNHPGGRAAAPRPLARAGRRSMDVMLQTNLRLVVSVARKYIGRGLELPDLIQEGSLGLIRGLELFDPTRGYAITTYAYWWIRQAITRAIHSNARTIRLPINLQETLVRIRRFTWDFQHQHGRAPSICETAQGLDVTPERVQQVLAASDLTSCASLDVTATDDGSPIVDLIPNPDDNTSNTPTLALLEQADTELLADALSVLPETEAFIVHGTAFDNRTMQDIADELQVPRARVQHLRHRALNRLRLYMAAQGYRRA
jgi:RNA polymerase sigma factor (sigma-70 family)